MTQPPQPQPPPQHPPPAAGALPPREAMPETPTVDRSLTVSSCPCGQVHGADDSLIGRVISKVSPQARHRYSYRGTTLSLLRDRLLYIVQNGTLFLRQEKLLVEADGLAA